ncbi:MAG: aminodeoxychorismate/anthranilate synthase component II [Hyphomicrobiales bacterium]
MIVLIDNYDSFTYNLVHFFGELGAPVKVYRNDAITCGEVLAQADAIVLSPGPCTPFEAGICLDLMAAVAGKIPVFGVCLGHQAIAQAYGAHIVRSPTLMHGKVSKINHDGTGVFAGLPETFNATRYHSLTIDPPSLPDCFTVSARADDGVIMGVAHKTLPLYGVQFHPESIATQHGHALLANFLKLAGVKTGPLKHKIPEPAHG